LLVALAPENSRTIETLTTVGELMNYVAPSNRDLLVSDLRAILRRCVAAFSAIFLIFQLSGCTSMTPGESSKLNTEEFMIPAADAGIQLYLRNKAPSDMRTFSAEKTVLFVHGATYPSEIYFDLKVGGYSWMEYLASRGYDVYMLDVRGYGRSTRPAAMSQAPAANPPFANTEDASRDISAAVNFILKRRGVSKLNLLGWSWGTTTTALYTTRNNALINKLVLFAPVWVPPTITPVPPAPTTAYRTVTVEAAKERWYRGVPADKQASLIPAGWFDTWAKAMLESDPEGAKQNPPVLRAPNGVMVDILGGWLKGQKLYDAAALRVPTLLIKAEWDADTPAYMAQGLFAEMKNAPYKSYLEIGEGTHTVLVEKNRLQLFRAGQSFLDEPAP
jgi:pimeloyl-ACP methyl ester carboxylesterase